MNDTDENTIGETLTPKQEAFCRYYTQDSELFSNGTLSYAKAYGHDLENASRNDSVWLLKDGREVTKELYDELKSDETAGAKKIKESSYERMHANCRSYASRLTTNDNIIKRVRQLLVEQMTEQAIDARLTSIILKGEDKDSIQAIKEFNKLKQRIVEKRDITSNGKEIGGFNFIRADETPRSTTDIKLPEPKIIADDNNNADNKANS